MTQSIKFKTIMFISLIMPVYILLHDITNAGAWMIAIALFVPVYIILWLTAMTLDCVDGQM